LVSFPELIAWLENEIGEDELAKTVITFANKDHATHRKELALSPAELNDVSMQKFRVYAIAAMKWTVIETFKKHYTDIMNGTFTGTLIANSQAKVLCKKLKDFDYKHGFVHRSVLEI